MTKNVSFFQIFKFEETNAVIKSVSSEDSSEGSTVDLSQKSCDT